MALTITQAGAVFDLLRIVTGRPPASPERFMSGLEALSTAACKALQVTLDVDTAAVGEQLLRMAGAPAAEAVAPEPDGGEDGVLWFELPDLEGGLVVDPTSSRAIEYRTGRRADREITRGELETLRDRLSEILATPQQAWAVQ